MNGLAGIGVAVGCFVWATCTAHVPHRIAMMVLFSAADVDGASSLMVLMLVLVLVSVLVVVVVLKADTHRSVGGCTSSPLRLFSVGMRVAVSQACRRIQYVWSHRRSQREHVYCSAIVVSVVGGGGTPSTVSACLAELLIPMPFALSLAVFTLNSGCGCRCTIAGDTFFPVILLSNGIVAPTFSLLAGAVSAADGGGSASAGSGIASAGDLQRTKVLFNTHTVVPFL